MKHSTLAIIATFILTACTQGSGTFTFVQMTDPQLRFTRDTGIEGMSAFQYDSTRLEQAVASINGLSPDFVVVTGDMVHYADNESDQQTYQRIIRKIDHSIPVYHIPGNHDIRNGADNAQVEAYIARFGYDRFSFKHNGSRFIGINSNVIRDSNKEREAEQFQWLSDELAAAKEKNEPAYVFSHCPVFLDDMEEALSYHAL